MAYDAGHQATAYDVRCNKNFNRMGGQMRYVTADNRDFLLMNHFCVRKTGCGTKGVVGTMKSDTPELLFSSREEFREWLSSNAQSSKGVWLVFGKRKAVRTLTAAQALEEALCFGWIDGQMQSIDETKYMKYFARRRAKSIWSDKNVSIVQVLREKGLVTEPGEQAIALAIQNGTWATQKRNPITDEQIESLSKRLHGISPAYENFMKMSPSVKRTYTGAYFAPKSDDARQRSFDRIVDRLNRNLKPM